MFCAWRLWMRRLAALDPAVILRTSSFVVAQSPARPANVVVILCDDQSVGDVVAFGAVDIGTLALDRFAREEGRFDRFSSRAPICSLSSASRLSGQWPRRAGAPCGVGSLPDDRVRPPEEITLPKLFRCAVDKTAHLKTWHLGDTPKMMANAQDFNVSFGHRGSGCDNGSHSFAGRG